jgi:hypothetical protein
MVVQTEAIGKKVKNDFFPELILGTSHSMYRDADNLSNYYTELICVAVIIRKLSGTCLGWVSNCPD